jgi:hypothetical protein
VPHARSSHRSPRRGGKPVDDELVDVRDHSVPGTGDLKALTTKYKEAIR